MSLTLPANSRGPILSLTLPPSTPALDVILRNVTTDKSLRLKLPASYDGDDLKLDFFRRTVKDQDGNDRSSLLSSADNDLWSSEPLVAGANTIEIEVEGGAVAAEDKFLQLGGNLGGKSLSVGGTWSTSGATTDFTVESTEDYLRRLSSGDTNLDSGRYAVASTPNPAGVWAEVETYVISPEAGSKFRNGLLARYVDANNWLMLVREYHASGSQLRLLKRVGGTVTAIAGPFVSTSGLSTPLFLGLKVGPAGNWAIYQREPAFDFGPALAEGTDAALATAGALDDGKVGVYGAQLASVGTPVWDNFKALDLAPVAYTAVAKLSWEKGYS
jgi:hypothetical protein